LESDFTVISYDRRGRGDSGDTTPYAVAREVEDLGAIITAVGGIAAVYGHSSGAAVVLNAAACGLPLTKVVLHEPPYGPADADSQRRTKELDAQLTTFLAEGRRSDAVELFLTIAGMPAEAAAQLAKDPSMIAKAATLAYDFAVIGNATTGGTIPLDLVRNVTQPALAVCGSASPTWMVDTTRRLADALPGAHYVELDGHDHVVPPEILAPVVTKFLAC
jgi:pimeloyl-ACP methyl ester carboxylesterase